MTPTNETPGDRAKEGGTGLTRRQLLACVKRLPRIKLDFTPTPLQDCTRLSKVLGGPRILVKRDDLTGLVYGGTKTRTIGFFLGEVAAQGVDTIIVSGFAKSVSNHCRLVTAAAARSRTNDVDPSGRSMSASMTIPPMKAATIAASNRPKDPQSSTTTSARSGVAPASLRYGTTLAWRSAAATAVTAARASRMVGRTSRCGRRAGPGPRQPGPDGPLR